MLSNIVGGMPGMDQFLQQQLLQLLMEQENTREEKKLVIRGVSWLCEPLKKARDRSDNDRASGLQADHSKAPPEIGHVHDVDHIDACVPIQGMRAIRSTAALYADTPSARLRPHASRSHQMTIG